MNRRAFLLGSAAAVATAAVPLSLPHAAPVFEGVVSQYNGVVIRSLSVEAFELFRRQARIMAIKTDPAGNYYMVAHPRMRPWLV